MVKRFIILAPIAMLALTLALGSVVFLAGSPTLDADGGPLGRPQTWADGELFNGVVTPATFKPESDPFDELYHGINTTDPTVFGFGFKDGVPLISESKPGDADYNGDRWHLNVLKVDVDPHKYANATSVEDLDLNDFQSTDEYFECPLRPQRGKN